jgi:acyl carrier protein
MAGIRNPANPETERRSHMEKKEALEVILEVVANCLAREPEMITPESRLVTDLGADSLDFLDIIFSLEQRFNVTFRGSEFDLLARLDLQAPESVRDGFLTSQIIDRLRSILPMLNEIGPSARVAPSEVFSFITVETLWIIIEGVLQRSNS